MPMPRWWARRINKRFINPRELHRGAWPVLSHVGRVSGTTYRTPIDAHPFDGGYLIVIVYGSKSDWVRNVLAAGRAQLRINGEDVELNAPRIVDEEEARRLLPAGRWQPPRALRIREFMRLEVAGSG